MLLAGDPIICSLTSKFSFSLESLYCRLEECAGVAVRLENKGSTGGFHDAGHDAYTTGHCFAKMLHYFPLYELEKYQNRLYAHNSVCVINLQGDDELPLDVALIIKLDCRLYWNIRRRK
eukprot:TRINITY_DN7004_c0_g1_i10.p3 TRINITY_DN7004_c0_g1~~TRINITY_DN7004_c0_g1_i10.p3  ORF type:complete len:119 (-),score=20.48 TRINITY_DN7004_c0_g1_i10:606-962(-)